MYALGRALRESGQALDRVGCRLQGRLAYVEQSEGKERKREKEREKERERKRKKKKKKIFFFLVK
jgi:Zn-finger nucleic acid-binding protein